MTLREPLPDYAPVIRAQIAADVRRLVGELQHPAEYVELGYLVNTHHGEALYATGDKIEGLPVRVDRALPRTIRVCADNVRFEEETYDYDEDLEANASVHRVWYDDVFEQTTW